MFVYGLLIRSLIKAYPSDFTLVFLLNCLELELTNNHRGTATNVDPPVFQALCAPNGETLSGDCHWPAKTGQNTAGQWDADTLRDWQACRARARSAPAMHRAAPPSTPLAPPTWDNTRRPLPLLTRGINSRWKPCCVDCILTKTCVWKLVLILFQLSFFLFLLFLLRREGMGVVAYALTAYLFVCGFIRCT